MQRFGEKQLERLKVKSLIDELDVWQSELKETRLKEKGFSSHYLLHDSTSPQLSPPPSAVSSSEYSAVGSPALNYRIIDSIMNHNLQDIQSEASAPTTDLSGNKKKKNQLQRTTTPPLRATFRSPTNESVIRPVTLTSLKMRRIDQFKISGVSRYSVDSQNNIIAKNDAQVHAE